MKKPGFILYCFVALALAQVAVPSLMIARYEMIAATGDEFKFRIQPVDPADVFRGRYVSLYLEHPRLWVPNSQGIDLKHKVYAILGKDNKGFAKILSVSRAEPATGAYLYTSVTDENNYPVIEGDSYEIKKGMICLRVHLPFSVYYMNEYKAPLAEQVYWSRDRKLPNYITVRFRWGRGVITGLFINGKKAEDIGEHDVKKFNDGY